MKPKKVATIYARDENGKILARAKVNNLSSSHVEGVKSSLLETVATMILNRRCEPRDVDIDDSEVVSARKKEQKQAGRLSEDEEDTDMSFELAQRANELSTANATRRDLTRHYELRRRSVPVRASVAEALPLDAPASPAQPGLFRRLFRGIRRAS